MNLLSFGVLSSESVVHSLNDSRHRQGCRRTFSRPTDFTAFVVYAEPQRFRCDEFEAGIQLFPGSRERHPPKEF